MTAEHVFEQMKRVVRASVRRNERALALEAAHARGFAERSSAAPPQNFDDLRYADTQGATVRLYAQWHNPASQSPGEHVVSRARLVLSVPGQPLVEHLVE